MRWKIGYKLLITQNYMDWYHTDSEDNPPENRPEYFKLGDIVKVIKPDDWCNDDETTIQSLDGWAQGIVPNSIVNEMRRSYLKRERINP